MKSNRRHFLTKTGSLTLAAVASGCHDHVVNVNTCCDDDELQTTDVLRLSVENNCTVLEPATGLKLLKGEQKAFALLADGVPAEGITIDLNMTSAALQQLFKVYPPPPTFTLMDGEAALFIINDNIGIQPRPTHFVDTDSNHSASGQFVYKPGRCTGGTDHVDYHIEC